MLGRLFRVAIVALLLFACYRIGQAYMAHYAFSDEVALIAQRGVQTDDAEVRAAVIEAATRLRIPIDPDRVNIRLVGDHVYIDLRYTRAVAVLPGYRRPWDFEVSAHGWTVPSGGIHKK
jgi:hypothetical protein